MTLTFNLRRRSGDPHTHTHKLKLRGQSVQIIERKQTDKRMRRTLPVALPFRLARAVKIRMQAKRQCMKRWTDGTDGTLISAASSAAAAVVGRRAVVRDIAVRKCGAVSCCTVHYLRDFCVSTKPFASCLWSTAPSASRDGRSCDNIRTRDSDIPRYLVHDTKVFPL